MNHHIMAAMLAAIASLWSVAGLAEWPPASLPDRMMQPESAQWGQFDLRPGLSVRYVSMQPTGTARGTIVVVPGVTSSPELEFELHRHFLDQGLAVWGIEMPGHGKSGRWLPNSHKVYIDDFATYTAAIRHLRSKVMQSDPNQPVLLMGTSMGGHIVMRYAGEYQGDFDGVIAQVPMLDVVTGDLPRWLVRSLAWAGDNLGFSESYIPGHGDWNLVPEADYDLDKSCCTSDPERDGIGTFWRMQEPALQMSGMTYGWFNKAYQSMAMVNEPEFLESIKVPLLMMSAGQDTLVVSDAHPPACALLPDCQLTVYPASRHVPTIERDDIRDKAMGDIDAFLAQKLGL